MNQFTRLLGQQLRGDIVQRRSPVRNRRLKALYNVADVRDRARRKLPRQVFDFVDGGANDEVTAGRNRTDFDSLAFEPHCLVDVSNVSTRTRVLGHDLAVPLIGAPTGMCGLTHHTGEVALARALHDAGTVYTTPMMASHSVEDVAAAAPGDTWLQLYMWRDRGFLTELLQRARAADVAALVLTVDVPRTGRRERDLRHGFTVPPRVSASALVEGARHPGWALNFVRHSPFLMANVPSTAQGDDVTTLMRHFAREFDPGLTWTDLDWIRERWSGPLVIKGILRPDDARLAVDAGADGVVVSNHGGRQLDGTPSAISVLEPIADTVEARVEVYLDGGVRRGSDVVKALALGARACFVGRPLLYGLAVAGEEGVGHVVRLLRREIELCLALSGCTSPSDVPSADLIRKRPS